MKYPIKGFIETSFSDWPGKIVAVLFLPTCNFRCRYCHNHDLVLRPEKHPDYPWEEIKENLRRRHGWIDGICLTGGEPTLHPWLPSLIRLLKSNFALTPTGGSLGIKVDTNGTSPEILQTLTNEGLVDYIAMDLKAPLETASYSRITGVPMGKEGLAQIQASIDFLLKSGVDYEFRTTVVPTFVTEEEVYTLARRIRGAKRYTLQNFSPRDPLDVSLRDVPPWDEKNLRQMQKRVNEIIKFRPETPSPLAGEGWGEGEGKSWVSG